MTRYIALVVIVAASLATGAQAHEARPGYLELRETASGRYDMLWKGPARGELRLKLDPVFPESCTLTGAGTQEMTGSALLWRTSLSNAPAV